MGFKGTFAKKFIENKKASININGDEGFRAQLGEILHEGLRAISESVKTCAIYAEQARKDAESATGMTIQDLHRGGYKNHGK